MGILKIIQNEDKIFNLRELDTAVKKLSDNFLSMSIDYILKSDKTYDRCFILNFDGKVDVTVDEFLLILNNTTNTLTQEALIYNHLSTDIDPKKKDFTLLGLKQSIWETVKGRRIERIYTDLDNKTVVRDCYSYLDNERGVVSYERVVEWLNFDQEIVFSKIIKNEDNIGALIKLNRNIRQNQIDYLIDSSIQLKELSNSVDEPLKSMFIQISDATNSIMKFYSIDIDDYVKVGDDEFENKLNGETVTEILELLSVTVPSKDGYYTVLDSILNQISK